MIPLDKTFLFCNHCGNRTMEPRYVCPACDWPRQHSELTPPPSTSLPDGNALSELAKTRVVQQHQADQPSAVTLTAAAPQVPATMAIVEVNLLPAVPVPLTSIVLAPEDPPADDEEPVAAPTPPADSIEQLLADISNTSTPKRKRK